MPPWQQRDSRLVAMAGRGDPAAFEEIYERYQPSILSFCRHLTGHREDAEDAVQHTFLTAYRELLSPEGGVEKLRPWLFAVARNRCLSLLKARRASDAIPPEEASLDGLAAEVERRQDLRDLVHDMVRLPDEQRAALVLSEMGELSHREVSAVLEVPPQKVKALVFQARSSLASTRAAREAPCTEIREQIAAAVGSALRRGTLRRHVTQCPGCKDFETVVLQQRRGLQALLPVAPSAGLYQAVFGSLGVEAVSVVKAVSGGAAGAGAGIASSGGLGGALGSLATLGAGGAVKLLVATTIVGGVAGAAASELPERLDRPADNRDLRAESDDGRTRGSKHGPSMLSPGDGSSAGRPRRDGKRGARGVPEGSAQGSAQAASSDSGLGGGPEAGGSAGGGETDGSHGSGPGGGNGGLPPGLAKRDEPPPGLAKRDELPPGLAKGNGGVPPGQAKKEERAASAPGASIGGQGNGDPGRNGNANENGGGNGGHANGGGPANGNPGGNGSANGSGGGNGGQANGGGPANGNPSGKENAGGSKGD